jgi:hypothetical protein
MKPILFTALILALFPFESCKKSVTANTFTPIRANVLLIDGNNNVANDNTSSIVTVETSNPVITIPVNAQGEFEIPSLDEATGITFAFSHPGYGTTREYYTKGAYDSIKSGMGGFQSVTLFEKSSVVVNSASGVVQNGQFKVTVNVSVLNAQAGNSIRFFIQKNNSAPSYNNCYGVNNISTAFPVANGDNTIDVCMKCEELCGFLPGDTAYIKAYGDVSPINFYIDPSTNKMVFPCVNTDSQSPILSFIVP